MNGVGEGPLSIGINARLSIDTDGDGMPDEEDAFPTDPAASVDSDDDGYPDAWNSGYTAKNSTTGLTLDFYPLDSDRWAESTDEETETSGYLIPIILALIIVVVITILLLMRKKKDVPPQEEETPELPVLEGEENLIPPK